MANKIGNWIESQRIESNRLWAWKVWPKIKLYLWNCNSIKFSKHTNSIGPSTNVDAAPGCLLSLLSLPCPLSLSLQPRRTTTSETCLYNFISVDLQQMQSKLQPQIVCFWLYERDSKRGRETRMKPYPNICIVYIE